MATYTFETLINGATMPGIVAAKVIADAGYGVLIIEWTRFAGGMVPSLGLPDYVGNTNYGLTTKFFQDIEAAAIADGATEATYGRHPNGLIRRYAPNWALTARNAMLATPGITLIKDIEIAGVVKDPTTKEVTSVTLTNGDTYVIGRKQGADLSYEGDLLRHAGIPMRYGRESKGAFNEYCAGVHVADGQTNPGQRRISLRGDVWKFYNQVPQDIRVGTGDFKTQAFNFRMTLSTETNRRVFQPPPGYRVEDFADWIDETNVRNMSTIENITSYQSITSTLHTTNGNDWPGHAWVYPRLRTKAERLKFIDQMYYRHAGQYYASMIDPRVPQAMRTSVAAHGLPATHNTDEYIGQPGWSSAHYVRICNRMVGQQTMTFQDVTSPYRQAKTDPVAIGGYNVDRHSVNYYPVNNGAGWVNEGHPENEGRGYYQIPFKSLKPNLNNCTNLLSGVCISMSDIVACSVRMEPTWMVIGQAVGLAIVAAIQNNVPVARLPYAALKERLVSAGAVITYA